MTNLPKLVFTIEETCQLLSLSRTTIWKLVKSKKLKVCRVGRRVLFTLQAIQDFLDQQEARARPIKL